MKKKSKLTKNKEKPLVLKKDTWTLKEIETYIDNLEYGKKRTSIKELKSIKTKVKRRIRIRKKKIKPNLKVAHKKKKQKSIIKKKPIFTPRKIISYGAIAIFGLLLVFYVILPTMQGSTRFLIVLSGSMSPDINSGDIVITNSINPEEIEMNDVITFVYPDNPDNYVTHRVVDITYEQGVLGFLTKGDANEDPDTYIVSSSEVVGKVGFVIPYLGYLPYFAKSLYGFLIFIIIPGSLLMINEMRKIIKNINEDKHQARKKIRVKSKRKATKSKIKKKKRGTYRPKYDYNLTEKRTDKIIGDS